jgi:transposase
MPRCLWTVEPLDPHRRFLEKFLVLLLFPFLRLGAPDTVGVMRLIVEHQDVALGAKLFLQQPFYRRRVALDVALALDLHLLQVALPVAVLADHLNEAAGDLPFQLVRRHVALAPLRRGHLADGDRFLRPHPHTGLDHLGRVLADLRRLRLEYVPIGDQHPALRRARGRERRRSRGALPEHLLRIEVMIEPPTTLCPCCSGPMHLIGEDRSERLDVIPMRYQVVVTRRPKYGCRACQSAVIQAPAPPRLIEGGLPTERMVAHVLVAKHADHAPLYRQAQMLARQGIVIDPSTLASWVGYAAAELKPLWRLLRDQLLGSAKLFADETTAPVLDPGRGRTKTATFGRSPATTGRGAAPIPRRWSIRTPRTRQRTRGGAAEGLPRHPADRRLRRLQGRDNAIRRC